MQFRKNHKLHVCDWILEKLPVMHKGNYLEIHNLIIQLIISQECM